MTTIQVKLRTSYEVCIADGLLTSAGTHIHTLLPAAKTAAVVTDDIVCKWHLEPLLRSLKQAGLRTCHYILPAGEAAKSGVQYFALLDWLTSEQLTRSDLVVALGGGVVGDLTGFAAATYLRGIPYVQVPTTLLAMVDSSVGGKTGIDLPAGKNLAGAFYQPALVLCDVTALDTLPEATLRDGLAEVIKYGMLDSARLLDQLLNDVLPDILPTVIATCVSMKRDIVQQDEFDLGTRMLLNFGHTVGHAIERHSGYNISHGEAVAIGMAVETRAAVRKDLAPNECLLLLESLLTHFGLPDRTDIPAEALCKAALHDKKRSGDDISLVVPVSLGKCERKKFPVAALRDWIEMGLQP